METYALLAFTDGDQWRLGIGDPSAMGWITVVAYFVAGMLCLKLALRETHEKGSWRSNGALFWWILCVALIFLGINKQLDLQTLLTLTARKFVSVAGLYEYRRAMQLVFMVMIVIGGLIACRLLYGMAREQLRENRLALAGFTFLVCFVIIRASSFHHLDLFLKSDIAGVKMNWVLELTGIGLIIANAIWRWRLASQGTPNGQPNFIMVNRRKA